MIRLTVYFLLGLICMLLQTTIVPWLIPSLFKPDLLLVLIVYVSLSEGIVQGAILSYILGSLHDVFAGAYIGLYGLVFLLLFLSAKAAMRWFDTESATLLLSLVYFGTLIKGGIVLFAIVVFADAGTIWPLVLKKLPFQALSTLLSAVLILGLITWFQARFAPRWKIPGLQRLDNGHGF